MVLIRNQSFVLLCFGFYFISTEKLAADETCDDLYYYCESMGTCLGEMGTIPCDETCGTWNYYFYCPNLDQCFNPLEKWVCDGACIDMPPDAGTHKPCNNETCAHYWFHLCEAEGLCVGHGIPCNGVCWEEETFLCDSPSDYCNLFSDINDLKFDCYDRSDETLFTEWEVTTANNEMFLKLEETLDPDSNTE